MITRDDVERRFGQVYSRSGPEFKVLCPACSVKSMWVNIKKDAYYCFSCGFRGLMGSRVVSGSMHTHVDPETKKIESILPKDFKWVKVREPWNNSHWEYVYGRGIDPASFVWGISGDYCVFPLWRDGKIIYWQGRNTMPFKPKTINPSKEKCGWGKSQLLYNYENEHGIIARKYVYLVEGVFDALTIGGLGMMGSVLSMDQAQLVSALMPKKIYQVLDSEVEKEKYTYNRNILRRMMPMTEILDVHLPEGDPNSLGQAEVLSLIARTSIIYPGRM